MSGRLSSHRFRRRAIWGSAGLVIAGAIAAAIAVGNTGTSSETPIDRTKPAWTYHPPALATLTRRDRNDVINVASKFVQTAVLRKQLDYAWTLLGPEMRAGQSRADWDTGNNNVVPFDAVGIAAWTLDYTYRNDVGLDLALIGSQTNAYAGKTFTIELKRYPARPHRWLVASWVPKGVGGYRQIKALAKEPPPKPYQPRISAKWLWFPGLFFFGILVLFLLWGLQSAIRQRRTARRFAEILGQTSRQRG